MVEPTAVERNESTWLHPSLDPTQTALCHLVDSSRTGDAEPDVAAIEGELRAFSPEIAARPQILVASKIDAIASNPSIVEHIAAL